LSSPGWSAAIAQVPAASTVAVEPATEQIAGVVEAKDTVRPEVAEAVSGTVSFGVKLAMSAGR
jgi:cation transport ATPase